jgi:hypothetical protein
MKEDIRLVGLIPEKDVTELITWKELDMIISQYVQLSPVMTPLKALLTSKNSYFKSSTSDLNDDDGHKEAKEEYDVNLNNEFPIQIVFKALNDQRLWNNI